MTWSEPWRVTMADGAELCVQACGSPEDPVVLLLAGSTASMDWWEDGFCERLAAGGRYVVRYDHRDTGASTTWPPGEPAYPGLALDGDPVALVESLGRGPAHLVGVSMGGGIAQYLALHHPSVVRSLTLIATTAVGGIEADLPGPEPRAMEEAPDPDWSDREAVVSWLVRGTRQVAGTLPRDESEVRAIAERVWERSPSPGSALNHHRLAWDADAPPDDVRLIGVPTLVLHGTADPLFPLPHGEALAAAIPGARFVPIQGMGHEHPPPATWDVVVDEVLAHTR